MSKINKIMQWLLAINLLICTTMVLYNITSGSNLNLFQIAYTMMIMIIGTFEIAYSMVKKQPVLTKIKKAL